jgi:hypothetical protein
MNESPATARVLLVLALTSAGCESETRGAERESTDAAPAPDAATPDADQPCPPELAGPIDPTLLIDDLEDRDGLIAQAGGRNGGWWVYSDGTGGTLDPPADGIPLPTRILGGRCGSEFAMRVTGQGFTDWGAGINLGFRYENDDFGAFDASRHSGVRFWARTGESNTSSIRVQLQDGNTYHAGGVCDENDRLGASACYNAHGTALVPLGGQWRPYEIAFDRLSQQNLVGSESPLDRARLYALEWVMQPGSVIDLWIDDVWFY